MEPTSQTQTPSLSELYAEAEKLAERPVEVEKLKNGKYVVLWMRFEVSPPKPGDTEEEALKNFLEYMLQLKKSESTI